METFPWHPDWKGRSILLTGIAASGLLIWMVSPEDPERPLILWFVVAPLFCLIDGSTTVDSGRRMLVRKWKWAACLPLWTREEPLDRFEAVTLRRNRNPWPGDPGFLTLVRKNGRFLQVGYFREKTALGPGARESAARLSKATGLPLADYPERRFSRPIPVAG